jgi:hypothetical protein
MVGVPAFGLWRGRTVAAYDLADLKVAQAPDEPRTKRQAHAPSPVRLAAAVRNVMN